jgi:hypothetical protein
VLSSDEENDSLELLHRLQGAAGDFAYDQMSENTLNSYPKLVNELKNSHRD